MDNNIDWEKIIVEVVSTAEENYDLLLLIDSEVTIELIRYVRMSIKQTKIDKPNVAKIAGIVVFWIRKLKPVSIKKESKNKLLTINEWVALDVGLAICRTYNDDFSKEKINIHQRLIRDWANSLRYHSHSPNSSMVSFELLGTER